MPNTFLLVNICYKPDQYFPHTNFLCIPVRKGISEDQILKKITSEVKIIWENEENGHFFVHMFGRSNSREDFYNPWVVNNFRKIKRIIMTPESDSRRRFWKLVEQKKSLVNLEEFTKCLRELPDLFSYLDRHRRSENLYSLGY
ncbi:MAG: hypothetical protein WC444_03220 [Candidatus Paceibacterota bacterium]